LKKEEELGELYGGSCVIAKKSYRFSGLWKLLFLEFLFALKKAELAADADY